MRMVSGLGYSNSQQRLQDAADKNRLANEASYKAWVASHPPEDIDAANKARTFLRRVSPIHRTPIEDDRLPKRPVSSWILFSKARWASPTYTGMSVKDATKMISSEWKEISASERQVCDSVLAP